MHKVERAPCPVEHSRLGLRRRVVGDAPLQNLGGKVSVDGEAEVFPKKPKGLVGILELNSPVKI